MTTDTAVRTTRMVILNGSMSVVRSSKDIDVDLETAPVENIPYVDHPEIQLDTHESTQMPFRYIVDDAGQPVMPQVRTVIAVQ